MSHRNPDPAAIAAVRQVLVALAPLNYRRTRRDAILRGRALGLTWAEIGDLLGGMKPQAVARLGKEVFEDEAGA